MKKKLLSLFLALVMALSLTACGAEEMADVVGAIIIDALEDDVGVIGGADGPTAILVNPGGYSDEAPAEDRGAGGAETPEEVPGDAGGGPESGGESEPPAGSGGEIAPIDEDASYNSAEDVALYLHTYGRLPDNYVTKSEARSLGWEGGSVEPWAGEGCAIGGSKFGNNEGLLPKGRQYYECDIDTVGRSSRGAKRIVYSDDGLIYYTDDHYESFTLLYGEE